jgi:hypothetical protein
MTSPPNGALPADVPVAGSALADSAHTGSAHTGGAHTGGAYTASGLRRFTRPQRSSAARAAEERCELCGERVGSEHKHMVDPQRRSIACACTACALLFTRAGGRYRTVPDRVRLDPAAPLTQAEWAELSIPVSVAFFFANSALGRVIASYPSPAGVTECELDLASWGRLAATHPLLRALEPDVEAILVVGGESVEAFLVPIDACYSLAGALRREWRGFDGGAEVRQIMADLLADLRRRARPLERAMTVREALMAEEA